MSEDKKMYSLKFWGKKTRNISNIKAGDVGIYQDMVTYYNENESGDAVKHIIFAKVRVVSVFEGLIEVEIIDVTASHTIDISILALATKNISKYLQPKLVKWQI